MTKKRWGRQLKSEGMLVKADVSRELLKEV